MADVLIVYGGRDYNDRECMAREMEREWASAPFVLVCGYDPDDKRFQGADQLAFEWGVEKGAQVMPFPAPWAKHGRAAGPIRNRRMAKWAKPTRGLEFPGGRGTAIMAEMLVERGVISRLAARHSQGSSL